MEDKRRFEPAKGAAGYDMTYDIRPHPEGSLLYVRAMPGSRQNGLVGQHQGRLKVAVTQVAEKGKANKAIVKVLASELNLKASQIVLVSGELSRDKCYLICGIFPDELGTRFKQPF